MRAQAVLTALLLTVPAAAEELRPALTAEVAFLGPDGATQTVIRPREPFTVALSFRARVAGSPPALAPRAMIRPISPTDLPCAESAAAFRASEQGPLGAIDLGGARIGVVQEENGFALLDPARALATANLIGAARFSEPPAALTPDPAHARFLVSLPEAGEIRAIDLLGRQTVLATDLIRPGPVFAPREGVAVVEGDGALALIDASRSVARARLGISAAAAGPDGVLALVTAEAVILARAPGLILARFPAAAPVAVAPLTERGVTTGIAWIEGETLSLGWLDGGEARITLGAAAGALALEPGGRFAFAYGGGIEGVIIADLALSRAIQRVAAHAPVAEIAFAPPAAYLRLADSSAVGVLDLRVLDAGRPAVIGEVVLGPAAFPSPGSRLLAPLPPGTGILAAHAPSYTGFVLDPTQATSGKPPSEAIGLRGGHPRLIAALDAGLRERRPGVFEAVARLPRGIPYELVVSAGLGQMAVCAPLPVALDPAPEQAGPGRIEELPEGGLRLTDAAGAPLADLPGTLTLSGLIGNWRREWRFRTDARGVIPGIDPRLAPAVVEARAGASRFAPLLIEGE